MMDVELAMKVADGTADVRDFAAWVEAANTLAAEVRRLRAIQIAGAAAIIEAELVRMAFDLNTIGKHEDADDDDFDAFMEQYEDAKRTAQKAFALAEAARRKA